ncbi:Gldg family protein [Patescibacteria group bacterium]|nr:Gldg family protein [Patescibacteria group bacterium]
MKIRNILKITKKEIQSYLISPSSYIVAVVFLLLWEFLFFKNAFLIGESSLRSLYSIFPWMMLMLVPAITMSSIAKEKDDGTLEWILTQPISELDFIVGKFLGAVCFLFLVLLFVIPIAFSFSKYGSFDWGVFAGQFLGSLLFGAAFIALGIFVSGLVGSQIAALLVSVAAGFILIISGTEIFTMSLPTWAALVSERLSLASHMNSVSRGVLDVRDLWYFLSFIFVFLGLAYLQMLKRRFGNRRSMYRTFQVGVTLLVGITVLTNIIGNRISGRLDLTQSRIYTLSDSTKRILNELDDIVTINFYVSDKLPAQYTPILRETKDLLRDYSNASKDNVVVKILNPSEDSSLKQQAAAYGVREVQFNVIGQEEFQLKTGYIGLAVIYAGNSESIPFIQSTADLEYQLTSFIKKLTVKDKKTVKFLAGHGEKDVYTDYSFLADELSRQYDISNLVLSTPNQEESEGKTPVEVGGDVDVLVVAGPNLVMADSEKKAIRDFINNGGSVLFLIDNYMINMEVQNVSENANSLSDLVSEYGVTINKDLMYDMRFNETVRFSDGWLSYFLPYPYWIKTVPLDGTNPITFKIKSVLIPWGSSLSISEQEAKNKGYTVTKLLNTTPFAGVKTEGYILDPTQKFDTNNLGEKTAAVSLKAENGGSMIIFGDSDFLSNQNIQTSPENLFLGTNAISWLSEEESLGDIRIKERPFGTFFFESEDQPARIKYVNMGLAFIVPTLYGGMRLLKRKKLGGQKFV